MNNIKELKALAKNLTVLYVEDEVALRDSVTLYLRKIFLHVRTASDGQEGLKSYQEHPCDIVISDIQMPHMNGLEMVKEIKAISPDQEVIIISAYSEAEYFLDAIRLGVNDYIIKPINHIQMNQVLHKAAYKLVRFKENIDYRKNLETIVQERTHEIIALEEEKEQNFENTLLAFIELIEDRDTYTGGHSQRVATYCKLIAAKMNYSDEECELLYRAGILHDIGKIATPDTVLLKPGKLNDLEYRLIQEHVKVGYDLLHKIGMYKDISEIILYHHERYDGKGYPRGSKEDEIPPLARVMIVADAFDAMTTNRIYKGRKEASVAVIELKELSGKQFHPEVIAAAVEVLSNIKVIDSISQLPVTEIEQERFSYFYRDQVTHAFNTDYLNLILNRNYFEQEYICLNALYMHNFSHFNEKHGWSEGDKLLSQFVDYLQDLYPLAMIFRFHGDDFVLISKEHLEIDMNQFELLDIFKKEHISISKLHIDLREQKIRDMKELEALI